MRPRTLGSGSSPKALNSPTQSSPSPRPSTNRPPESTARLAACRARTCGRRRASGVTIGPNTKFSGLSATAAQHVHTSAMAVTRSPYCRWSQTKKPSHPAVSAAAARSPTTRASASGSNGATNRPRRVFMDVIMPTRPGAKSHVRLTGRVDSESDLIKRELLGWLDAQRAHVVEQVRAMPAETRRRSCVPSGWTPRGLVRHLALDVERVWFRAVMAGQDVELPQGYEGWTAPDSYSDEELLQQYADECRLATSAVEELGLDAAPVWWFEDAGDPPHSSLREVLL